MGEGKSTVIIPMAAAPRHEGAEPADNAVMQLNMGEGKSAVMIPMIHEAAALTNGSQLVRVAVAKPQSKQMAEMLIARFGGLLGRRIYYIPSSRSLKLDKSAAETMLEVPRQCRRTGGILLVQPKHAAGSAIVSSHCTVLAARRNCARGIQREGWTSLKDCAEPSSPANEVSLCEEHVRYAGDVESASKQASMEVRRRACGES
jgi:hypothetical protein